MTPFQASWVEISVAAFVVFGWFSMLAGQALARTWRPWWHCIGYGLLLSVGARLVEYVLFIGRAQNLDVYVTDNSGFMIIGTIYLIAVTLAAHRLSLARMMVTQYPWLYERAGLFAWRPKA